MLGVCKSPKATFCKISSTINPLWSWRQTTHSDSSKVACEIISAAALISVGCCVQTLEGATRPYAIVEVSRFNISTGTSSHNSHRTPTTPTAFHGFGSTLRDILTQLHIAFANPSITPCLLHCPPSLSNLSLICKWSNGSASGFFNFFVRHFA